MVTVKNGANYRWDWSSMEFWGRATSEDVIVRLQQGADPNSVLLFRDKPLHQAATRGLSLAVQALLDDGADIEAVDLLDRTPLHRATPSRSPETIQVLIDNGAKIGACDHFGNTALQTAVLWGTPDEVDVLIKAGASLHVLNKTGETVVDLAQANLNSATMTNFLRDAGASMNNHSAGLGRPAR